MLFRNKKHHLGKTYQDGEIIFRKGELASCLYIIMEGTVEIILEGEQNNPMQLAVLGQNDVFGDLALFDNKERVATARAKGEVRVLSVDKKVFLQRIGEDPSFTLRVLIKMATRTKTLVSEVIRLRQEIQKLSRQKV